MTGYIDDITSCAAMLLFFGAVLTAALRRRFPTANRLLSFAALGTVAVMTLLLIIFVIAVAASASPRLPLCAAQSRLCGSALLLRDAVAR